MPDVKNVPGWKLLVEAVRGVIGGESSSPMYIQMVARTGEFIPDKEDDEVGEPIKDKVLELCFEALFNHVGPMWHPDVTAFIASQIGDEGLAARVGVEDDWEMRDLSCGSGFCQWPTVVVRKGNLVLTGAILIEHIDEDWDPVEDIDEAQDMANAMAEDKTGEL